MDGANFVISKMHFNSGNNYYITLGLSQNISPEEIRERWKNLMLLYHPDRQADDDSWVTERAKKVNEAYSILKDNGKRKAFDRKLLEQTAIRNPSHQPRATASVKRSRSGNRMISQDPEWDRKKRNIPKILVGIYILAALLFLISLYIQNNSEQLENVFLTRKEQGKQAHLFPKAASGKEHPENFTPSSPLRGGREEGSKKPQPHTGNNSLSEEKNVETRAVMQKRKDVAVPAAPDTPGMSQKSAVKQQNRPDEVIAPGYEAPHKAPSLLPPTAAPAILIPQTGIREADAKASVPPVKDVPATDYRTKKTEQAAPVRPEPVVSAQPVQNQKTADITHEDVEDFMKQYSSVYAKSDINAFMSLFSRSAVENNRLHYHEMKEAYRQTFSEKIAHFRINNISIMLNGQTASVSGIYDLSRYSSAEERWIRYSGRIQWKLIRENNDLKIISMNYDK